MLLFLETLGGLLLVTILFVATKLTALGMWGEAADWWRRETERWSVRRRWR